MGHAGGVIPESMSGSLVAASESCIAVGTAAECDEPVDIVLTDEQPGDGAEMWCVKESELETPNNAIAICSVLNDTLMTIEVAAKLSAVQIWVNHPTEPTKIVIVVGQPEHK